MSDHVFEPVPTQFNFSKAEKETIAFWKEHGIYEKSSEQRKDAPPLTITIIT